MGDSISADWDKEMDGRTRTHRFRYHLARGFVVPDDIVLDLGCGKGYGSEILAEVANKVIGVDKDEGQIVRNQDIYEDASNIVFIHADIEKDHYPHGDVACLIEALEHCFDAELALKQVKKNTRKWLIITVPIGEKLIEVDGVVRAEHDGSHHTVFGQLYDLVDMVVDKQWRLFYHYQLSNCGHAVFYNYENI